MVANRKLFRKISIVLVGAALGFAYYKFIGCRSGVCPITSNPWISTMYGALLGFVISLNRPAKKNKNNENTRQESE